MTVGDINGWRGNVITAQTVFDDDMPDGGDIAGLWIGFWCTNGVHGGWFRMN